MNERLDDGAAAWPLRPWIMAAICSAAGLILHSLTEHQFGETLAIWKQAAATFVAVGTISFVVTVEQRRWAWSLYFAIAWGLVTALVGWFSAGYNQDATIFEWPYLAGIFAVLLAAPLFQTVRDEGAWRFPYRRLHSHAWTDAVIGAASLFFTGITFLLAWLIAGLFGLIGIDAVKELLEEEWFAWMLAGFAFGAAVGLLRERDRLVATLQRLVMVVFSVLAPVLAFALAAFLLSIPFTGLDELWDSWVSATALLLLASAGAVLLANAVIGDGAEERSQSRVLHWSALALVAVVLPLAVIAAVAMGIRIGQYGWTPERIWGAIAVGVAIAYGLAGWWAIARARLEFDEPLRPLQTKLALGLCGLALLLALPILDFGAISARSQMARLEAGKVTPEEFDWTAMAFDFGPEGRERLSEIARTGAPNLRAFAQTALDSDNRYGLARETESVAQSARIERYVRILSPDIRLTEALKLELAGPGGCNDKPCALVRIDAERLLLVHNPWGGHVESRIIDLTELGKPATPARAAPAEEAAEAKPADLGRATIKVRPVERRQLYVNGEPVGTPFE